MEAGSSGTEIESLDIARAREELRTREQGLARSVAGPVNVDPIEIAQSAQNVSGFQQALLDALQGEVGFDVAFMSGRGGVPYCWGMGCSGISLSRRYEAEFAPVKRAALGARGVAVDTEVLGEQGVQRCSYYRDIAQPQGGRHSLLAVARLRGEPLGGLVLGRAGACFSTRDVGAIEEMLPSLAVAWGSFDSPCPEAPLPEPPPPSKGLWGALRRWGTEPLIAEARSGKGSIIVRDRGGYREMVERQGGRELVWTRASLADPARSGWPYLDLFSLAATLARRRERALFIGCGGAVSLRQFARLYPGISLDLVELSPEVIALARQWYGLDQLPKLSVHIGDGIHFLEQAPSERWDVIVMDAYDGCELPAGFRAREFFDCARKALVEGGAVGMNVIGTLVGSGPVQEVVDAARGCLGDVRVIPVLEPEEEYSPYARRNVVVVGTRDKG